MSMFVWPGLWLEDYDNWGHIKPYHVKLIRGCTWLLRILVLSLHQHKEIISKHSRLFDRPGKPQISKRGQSSSYRSSIADSAHASFFFILPSIAYVMQYWLQHIHRLAAKATSMGSDCLFFAFWNNWRGQVLASCLFSKVKLIEKHCEYFSADLELQANIRFYQGRSSPWQSMAQRHMTDEVDQQTIVGSSAFPTQHLTHDF